jgi:hypothetical protein
MIKRVRFEGELVQIAQDVEIECVHYFFLVDFLNEEPVKNKRSEGPS